jgi:hypothetical protein
VRGTGGEIIEGSELFGKAFEHLILLEVRAFLSYASKNTKGLEKC